MNYKLDDIMINKVREAIKDLSKKKKMWKHTKERAEIELQTVRTKYHHNVKKRITDAQKEIDKLDKRIKEFKDSIRKGYITI